jgi:threonylcarbamoyladenosine tRNA methylthiotransferase MtaB
MLKNDLERRGFKVVTWPQKAALYIINTCSVTAKAERETRQIISQIKKKYPKSLILVTGCFVDKNNRLVDFWQKNKKKIIEICQKIDKQKIKKAVGKLLDRDSRTRVFIKIQDGCHQFCAYCIVPFLRGKPKSRAVLPLLTEIKEYEKLGGQEIVLVGTNIGEYGSNVRCQIFHTKTVDLEVLLRLILERTEIKRIRLSSLWPTKITKSLISLFQKNRRLCPHFHLSIQSASDQVLKLMGRNYTKADVEGAVKMIKKIPDAILTADFIVGFPGESERDFKETYNFIKKQKFFRLHIFRYSKRPWTRAEKMPDQVPEKIKKERSQKLIELGKKLNQEIREKFLNKTYPVLFEQKTGQFWQGLTPNYLKVFVKSRKNIKNEIYNVHLFKLYKDGILGKIV